MSQLPVLIDNKREALASAFDGAVDPLASHTATFERFDIDPFELFSEEVLARQEPAAGTRRE